MVDYESDDRDIFSDPDDSPHLSDAMINVLRRRADQTLCEAVQDQQTMIGNIRTNVTILTSNVNALAGKIDEFTNGTDLGELIKWVKEKQEKEREHREMVKKLKQSGLGYLVTVSISAFIAAGGILWEKIRR